VSNTSVTWWGHSTLWLTDSGSTLLTDPVLTDRLAHLRRAAGPTPQLPGEPDAILLSHLHADHFHLASLRAVPGKPLLIVPRGAAGFAAKALRPRAASGTASGTPSGTASRIASGTASRIASGTASGLASRIVELAPGEQIAVGGVKVRGVPAAHDGGRGPWSRERAHAMGFVVEGAARTWFAGDTGLFDGMSDLGPLDLALIPVGGWGPTLGSHGHLDAISGAEALRRSRAGWAVPVHYGTLWPIGMARVRQHMFREPGVRFAEEAARVAPDAKVRVLAHGETLTINPIGRPA
jgi:L-ascorbate metabolism protein UlaG (beta-lactamase superfamily)